MQALEVEVALAELAAGQWGLFTTQQAQTVGVSRVRLSRLTQAGALLRLTHGVYALRGASGTGQLELRAAWLAADPTRTASQRIGDGAAGIVVSHTSAAYLYGFGDLDADRHEFTSTARKQTRRSDVRFHRSFVSTSDITLHAGLPVATPARLVADLLADGRDSGHVAGVLADAVRTRAIVVGDLPERLAPFAARFGHATGDGQRLLDQLLDLGGVLDQVVADQLTDIARADNKSLAELLSTAVGNQALAGFLNILTTPGFANAFASNIASDAVANLAPSPALAAALQGAASSAALIQLAQSPALTAATQGAENASVLAQIARLAQSPAMQEILTNTQINSALEALTRSPAAAGALQHTSAVDAIGKMMESPAIAAAFQSSAATNTLVAHLARSVEIANAAASATPSPANRTRRVVPAAAHDTAAHDAATRVISPADIPESSRA